MYHTRFEGSLRVTSSSKGGGEIAAQVTYTIQQEDLDLSWENGVVVLDGAFNPAKQLGALRHLLLGQIPGLQFAGAIYAQGQERMDRYAILPCPTGFIISHEVQPSI